TAAVLRGLHLRGPLVTLEWTGFARLTYANLPCRWVAVAEKKEGFRRFIREHGINVIVLAPDMKFNPALHDDPEFQEFLAGGHGDFALVPVPNIKTQIAVRNDLVNQAPAGAP